MKLLRLSSKRSSKRRFIMSLKFKTNFRSFIRFLTTKRVLIKVEVFALV